jgi:hypothetical protein
VRGATQTSSVVALLVGAIVLGGCGDSGDSTSSGASGASGATGAASSGSTASVPAQDAEAEATARTAQTTMEVYATDNGGSYAGVKLADLVKFDPKLENGSSLEVTGDSTSYSITATSESGGEFTIARDASGKTTFSCTPEGQGNCPSSGDWGS